MAGWLPVSRKITVAANPDVAPYQGRHGAIFFWGQVRSWLGSSPRPQSPTCSARGGADAHPHS